jgi:hypothetical protein
MPCFERCSFLPATGGALGSQALLPDHLFSRARCFHFFGFSGSAYGTTISLIALLTPEN